MRRKESAGSRRFVGQEQHPDSPEQGSTSAPSAEPRAFRAGRPIPVARLSGPRALVHPFLCVLLSPVPDATSAARTLRVRKGAGAVPGSVGTPASGGRNQGRNPRPSRRGLLGSWPRLAAARLAAVLLVLVAPSVALVPPAFAEEVPVWSATLNPVVISHSGNVYGCQGSSGPRGTKCTESSVLSDRSTFDLLGTEYQITYIATRPDTGNRFRFQLNVGEKTDLGTADTTDGALDHLVLYVGSRRLPFAEAQEDSAFPGHFDWYSLPSSIHFSAGDPVQLRMAARVFTGTLEEVDPVERKDGRLDYRFDLKLRERIWMHYKDMRDHAFDVTNGRVVKAKRMGRVGRQHIDGRARKVNKHWRLTVRPTDPDGDISISLPSQPCSEQGAVCTPDGKRLQEELELDISAVKQLSVSIADTTAEEDDEYLKFDVTLSRPAEDWVELYFKTTAEGTATEGEYPLSGGEDYIKVDGWFVFVPGETSKEIWVPIIDDDVDDDGETVVVQLTEARMVDTSSSKDYEHLVPLEDDKATGTIDNADALPRALLARFGRAAAVHVVETVEERMQAPREPGFTGRFAGRELRRGMERDVALDFLSELGGMAGAGPAGGALHGPLSGGLAAGLPASLAAPGVAGGGGQHRAGLGSLDAMAGPRGGGIGPRGGLGGGGLLDSAFGGGDVLTGSAFALNRRTRAGGIVSFWSRSAQSHFAGREGALALDGAVRTTMVGADYGTGPLVAGLSLAHSRGLGGYDGVSAGRVASAVTGLYPWLGYQVSQRVSVWGVTGYGAGGLLLTPAGGPALESGLSMKMAAAGTRGELVGNGTAGFGLAFKADALWVGTAVDGVDGPAGRMAATEAAASRVRTALEGSRGYVLGGGLSLKPSVEVGLRHDGGDAEQGSGIDVGGGLVVFDPSTGLSVNVQVRMLLVHEAEGFSERGVSVSVSWSPTPSTPLGFTARVAPSWGGQAAGGAQALWGRETMADMAHGGFAQGDRLDGEVGYGLPVGSRFVGTPRVRFTTSEYGRDYRVGYGLGLLNRGSMNFELGVDAQRRESAIFSSRGAAGRADQQILGRASLRW